MASEITGRWEDLLSRPEFRGDQVRVTIVDQEPAARPPGDWLESLHRMASNGVQIMRPADDSRETIYEAAE